MKTLTLILLLIAAQALAYHSHVWLKQNEVYGRDAAGNQVVICTWKCTSDFNNQHFIQTQGFGVCPMPPI